MGADLLIHVVPHLLVELQLRAQQPRRHLLHLPLARRALARQPTLQPGALAGGCGWLVVRERGLEGEVSK